MHRLLPRRLILGLFGLAAAAGLTACGTPAPSVLERQPPIVFVHGNGDTAALWHTTIWRFESNGWPTARLHAIELPYPLARDADDKPQPGRSSSAEAMQHLSGEVDKVLTATGARKVVLVGNSRGAITIRNYIANGGGAAKVSHAVLGGGPLHGVWNNPGFRPTNEFNGAGPLLQGLNNQGAPGVEITPGVQWMTIRSDNNDKFAQPDGVWIGAKGTPTNVSFDGPALKGANNVVIAGIDHRETSFSPQAFEATYRFITGRAPATLKVVPQGEILLDGVVTGLGVDNKPDGGNFVNNLPLPGARVTVYETDAATGQRMGDARHDVVVGPTGRWGPFKGDSRASYEFVVGAPGFATAHIYRSPFARSSAVVNLRAVRMAEADRSALSVVTLTRPRGYFGVPRDRISLDGASPPAGIPAGVAGVSVASARIGDTVGRSVAGEFNGERIVGRAWPSSEGRVVLLELHD